MITVPMSSEEECEIAGQKVYSTSNPKEGDIHGDLYDNVRYLCLKGK